MSSVHSQEYLRLMKATFGVAADVFRDYIDFKIIEPNFSKSFVKFVTEGKHDFYHASKESTTVCCLCQNDGGERHCNVIKKWIFFNLYEEITDRKVQCIKKLKKLDKFKSNKCICKYIPKSDISLQKLDITVLYAVLKVTNELCPEAIAINEVRNELCHSTDSLQTSNVALWQKLEKSVCDLAARVGGKYYARAISTQLAEIADSNVSTEEHRRLLEYFTNISITTQERVQETAEQQQLSIEKIKDEVKIVKDQVTALFKLFVDYHKKAQGEAEDIQTVDVNATIDEVPSEWNTDEIKRNLENANNPNDIDEDEFQLCGCSLQSIVINLIAPVKVLRSKETLKRSLYNLLTKILEAGRIDTNVSANIIVRIENRDPSGILTETGESAYEIQENYSQQSFIQPAMALFEINFLQNIVLDVFPQIVREWLSSLSSEQLSKLSLKDRGLKKLYSFIKDSNLVKAPLSGWFPKVPSAVEISPEADIVRMMHIRHDVCNRSSSYVSSEEWEKHFTETIYIVKRFDKKLQKESDVSFERQTKHLFNYWTFAVHVFKGLENFEIQRFDYAFSTTLSEETSTSTSKQRKQSHASEFGDMLSIHSKSSADSGLGSDRGMVGIPGKRKQKATRQISFTDTVTKTKFFTPPNQSEESRSQSFREDEEITIPKQTLTTEMSENISEEEQVEDNEDTHL